MFLKLQVKLEISFTKRADMGTMAIGRPNRFFKVCL